MPAFSQRICGITLALFAVVLGSCSRVDSDKSAQKQSPSPTANPAADDVWVARHAMSLGDVLLMLKAGYTEKTIIAEVKRRHFVGNLVEATELQLTLAGARHELISALKDKDNWLTEPQEQAYGQLMAQHKPAH
jgi:PBP1b-binding outer membrane lipoprotein LpoB